MTPPNDRDAIDAGLKKVGFGGLNDPTLFDQIAFVVSGKGPKEGHLRFRSMLLCVEPEQRRIAYHAIAPKLRFKAKPLEDYLAEGATIAERKQLPSYDPKTLAVVEWRPQEIETKEYKERVLITCKLCAEGEAVTTRGSMCNFHFYGTPKQTICADSEIYIDGYPVAERIEPIEPEKLPDQSVLERHASNAIARELREQGAKIQFTISCVICTREGSWRAKRRKSCLKLATQEGWHIEGWQGKTRSLCPACANN